MLCKSHLKTCKILSENRNIFQLFKTILCLNPISVWNKLIYQAARFGTVVTMSRLVVFGRQILIIGQKFGQLVIIDLLVS